MVRLAAFAAIALLGFPGSASAQTTPTVEQTGFTGTITPLEAKPPAGYLAVAKIEAGEAAAGRVVVTRSKTTIEPRAGAVLDLFVPRSKTSRAPDIVVLVKGSTRITTDVLGARVDAGTVSTTLVKGDARVSLFDDGAAVSNHGALPIRVKVDKRALTIPTGQGLSSRGGAAAIAELPAIPSLVIGAPSGPSTAGAPFTAQVSEANGITAVAAIRAAGSAAPIAIFETTRARFESGGLGAGRYTATAWARTDSGLESPPGAVLEFEASVFAVIEPGTSDPVVATPAITATYKLPTMLPGTVLRRPEGECTLGIEPPAGCPDLGIGVYQVSATLAENKPLTPGTASSLRIDIATNAPELDLGRLRLQAGDAAVRETSTASDHITAAVQPLRGATAATLSVSLGAVTVARFDLAVSAPPPPSTPPVIARKPAPRGPTTKWEFGGLIGVTLLDDENDLGNSPDRSGVLDGGAIVGVRAGYAFTPSISAEAEGTYSQPGFVSLDDHANVLNYRVHGQVFLSEGRIRPFALLGIGGSYLSTDSSIASNESDIEGYWGLGARFAYDARKSVRLDLRHRIGRGRVENTSNLFEASLGISWRL